MKPGPIVRTLMRSARKYGADMMNEFDYIAALDIMGAERDCARDSMTNDAARMVDREHRRLHNPQTPAQYIREEFKEDHHAYC